MFSHLAGSRKVKRMENEATERDISRNYRISESSAFGFFHKYFHADVDLCVVFEK